MPQSPRDGRISSGVALNKDDFQVLHDLFSLGSWLPVPGSPTDEESQIWAGPCFFPALLLSRLERLVQSILTHQLHQRPARWMCISS